MMTFAPALLFAWGWLVAGSTAGVWGWAGLLSAALAAVLATLGVGVERWLFFAEARHTVSLYYGTGSA